MKNILIIKMGGKFTNEEALLLQLAEEMLHMSGRYHFIIIHGGGAEVSALSRKFGIEPVFKDGIRITTREEMMYVDKVLSGKINKRLVRVFQRAGFDAVGLTGSDGRIFIGSSLSSATEDPSHTGRIVQVNPYLLEVLLKESFLPIIGSTSMDTRGMPLNINADEVAFKLSGRLKSRITIFLSDIPGILKEGNIISRITTKEIETGIDSGVITGGMIPKVKSAARTLACGVERIIIGQYQGRGALQGLVEGRSGTAIVA